MYDNAGRRCLRADEFEGASRSSLCKEALSLTQHERIDEQKDLIREPMFDQRRCQRGAAP